MKALLYRSVWLPAMVTAVLLLIALSLLVAMSWRSLQRLEPMREHLALVDQVQRTGMRLQQLLIRSIRDNAPLQPRQVRAIRDDVDRALALNGRMDETNLKRLRKLRNLLTGLPNTPQTDLIQALNIMRQVISSETVAHDRLLNRVKHDTTIEFEIAAGIMILFPMAALLTLFFMRHRILTPLNNLRSLLSMLAQQDYSSASTKNVDTLLLPLFENYNHLVGRLAEYEQAHQARQQTLENEVRGATHALLQQQRSLANSERLAAVGEVAAAVAHELRNPLAGIQVALGNLRNEMTGTEQAERLDMVLDELKRIARMLNDLLSQARQVPEPAKTVELKPLVDQLLALTRYQLAEPIHLQHRTEDGLRCRLPESGLRQALLNLVLNAAAALGDSGGHINVSAKSKGEHLEIVVTDDGPGFPATLLETGVRAFATNRDHGTGLGLAMVRRFAMDLGGELRLTNIHPHGACATLYLPCKELRHA